MVTQTTGKTGRKPGTPKTGGRQKGTSNKMTRELKDMILGALDQAGGMDYLAAKAESHPAAFLGLVGKVLPMKLANADGSNLNLAVHVKFRDPGVTD